MKNSYMYLLYKTRDYGRFWADNKVPAFTDCPYCYREAWVDIKVSDLDEHFEGEFECDVCHEKFRGTLVFGVLE